MVPALAFAKGNNDGSNRANAFTTTLIDETDCKLVLNVWNQYDSASDKWQVHADAEVTTVSLGDVIQANICIEFPDTANRYDCLGLRAFASLADLGSPGYGSEVTLGDSYQASGPSIVQGSISLDDETTQDPSISWMEEASRTFKDCAEGEPGSVSCDVLNFSMYRDFTTSSTDQDVQLSADQADQDFNVWGQLLVLDFNRILPTVNYDITDAPTTVKLVSQAAIDAYTNDGTTGDEENDNPDDVIPDGEGNPDAGGDDSGDGDSGDGDSGSTDTGDSGDGDSGDGSTDGGDGDSGDGDSGDGDDGTGGTIEDGEPEGGEGDPEDDDTGATSVTTMAATVLAAIAALAF